MKRVYRILAFTLVLVFAATGCTLKLKSHFIDIKTGPEKTVELRVPMPETAEGVELNLHFLFGDLKLSPGSSADLATGTATFNAMEFEPELEVNGAASTLTTGEIEIAGFPKFPKDLKNQWDVHISDAPMSLNIKTGPYEGEFELGGLALEKLFIDEVGSDARISFSKPNLVDMSSFTYMTGGSSLVIKGLANANFEQMTFESGAGDFTLSFDGDLKRDASVSIDSGASTVNIIVPQGVNAEVTFDGGLTGINLEDGWTENGNVYTHPGSGPMIAIKVAMGLGDLNLKSQ